MPSSRILIASNTLSTSAASVTFSSIPSTYTDLVLKFSTRSDRAQVFDSIAIRFNGDSASNYSRIVLNGNGTSTSSVLASSQSFWEFGVTNADSSTANTFGNGELYIPNYTSTSSRPGSYFGVQETNATTAYIRANAYLYRGSSAISSIAMTPQDGTNWLSGSTFWLYGLKNS